jgi:hypothetical protein
VNKIKISRNETKTMRKSSAIMSHVNKYAELGYSRKLSRARGYLRRGQ